MDLGSLLNALEGVEQGLADLYGWFAECFEDEPAVAGTFYRLGIQERSHVNLVRYGRTLVRRAPKDFRPVQVETALVEELVRAILSFRRAHPGPTVAEAVAFALWAERHAAERIHRAVLVDSNPSLAGVVASLACADREHVAMLEAMARSRGLLPHELPGTEGRAAGTG